MLGREIEPCYIRDIQDTDRIGDTYTKTPQPDECYRQRLGRLLSPEKEFIVMMFHQTGKLFRFANQKRMPPPAEKPFCKRLLDLSL